MTIYAWSDILPFCLYLQVCYTIVCTVVNKVIRAVLWQYYAIKVLALMWWHPHWRVILSINMFLYFQSLSYSVQASYVDEKKMSLQIWDAVFLCDCHRTVTPQKYYYLICMNMIHCCRRNYPSLYKGVNMSSTLNTCSSKMTHAHKCGSNINTKTYSYIIHTIHNSYTLTWTLFFKESTFTCDTLST